MWVLIIILIMTAVLGYATMHEPRCKDCGLKMIKGYDKRDGAYYTCPHCGDTITVK